MALDGTVDQPPPAKPEEDEPSTDQAPSAGTFGFASFREKLLLNMPGSLPPSTEGIGLCLSGGGVRAATFSLGVLQALGARNVFTSFDYLSTVSGGGYTGSALLAGLKRQNGDFPFGGSSKEDVADNRAAKGLRDRCRYLMPNGWFDLVVSLAIIFRGLAVNAVMVLTVIMASATVTLFFNPDEGSLRRSWLLRYFWKNPNGLELFWGRSFFLSKLLVLVLLIWLIFWAIGKSLKPSNSSAKRLADPGSEFSRWTGRFTVLILIVFFAEFQQPVLRFLLRTLEVNSDPAVLWRRLLNWISGLMVGTSTFAVAWRTLVGWIKQASKDNSYGGYVKSALSKGALLLLASTIPLLIYAIYLCVTVLAITHGNNAVLLSAGTISFTHASFPGLLLIALFLITLLFVWSHFVGAPQDTICDLTWLRGVCTTIRKESTTNKVARKSAITAVLIAIAAIVVFTGVGVLCFIYAGKNATLDSTSSALLFYLAITFWCLLISGLFTANANSLNRLYRDRLNEAFGFGPFDPNGVQEALKHSRKHSRRREYIRRRQHRRRAEKSFQLSDLVWGKGEKREARPYPIINAAMNIEGSNRIGHRNADFFVFSPLFIGSDSTGYIDTKTYQTDGEAALDLATATAISGAAVSSVMGQAGIPILSPTLALLNIRLGYWARNPWAIKNGRNIKRGIRDWKIFYLVDEMLGWLDERRERIYLTDGGHIDNLGVYQLLKRRCKFIVVVDAEADPTMSFPSLIQIERFARIDMGVRIRLSFEAMADEAVARKSALKRGDRPAPRSQPWHHAAVGTILYPNGDEGFLLYVKASVTGDEPSYVLDYERRNPTFPHESTGDQFFTEEQFEAYRALGFHAMDAALQQTDNTVESDAVLEMIKNALQENATRA